MRKGFRILILAVILAVAAGMAWLATSQPGEPVYQGKRLSLWLQEYPSNSVRTVEAVRAIGTNSIPTLLRFLREDDSSLKYRLLKLLRKQKLFKIPYTSARICNQEALHGFQTLGSSASNAVPELIRIYVRNMSPDSEWTTAQSLAFIGPAASNAVPALLGRVSAMKVMTRTNQMEFICALFALGQIHAQPEVVVPALTELLRARDNLTPFEAAIALGEYGPAAKPALPLMIKYYDTQSDKAMKAQVAEAIRKVDPKAAEEAWIQ
jgi:hypothetical protein